MIHRFLSVTLISITLTGCATLGYYVQAISGEVSILTSRRDITDVIADPDTPPATKAKLEFALRVRSFASQSLHLPDNDSYRTYVKLDRRFPVWVVYAAPPFSLAPVEWCYPFAGCVPYRGYFARDDAAAFAAKLRKQGKDVYLGGAPSYSTLGWFADPLFSNMLRWSRVSLAGLIFHELAHQQVYIEGAAQFNESFADTVETVGIERWLTAHGEQDKLKAYHRIQAETRAFQALVGKLRQRLKKIYAAPTSAAVKRRKKALAIEWLKRQHAALVAQYDQPIYSEWFTHPLNNASLAVVTTYNVWQPAFQQLLRCDGGRLEQFYADVKALAALEPAARRARLKGLTDTGLTPTAYTSDHGNRTLSGSCRMSKDSTSAARISS
ncbi:MAG TPA: aminopeptidase [Gammaproteobacteria bacterium]|nr:aminopeptidase [Gammaproteobacteria bacterium]